MKTIYIPKGETVHYESLSTEHLIVEGTLEVTYGVVAKQIDGDGVIHAGTVEADIIRIRCIETARTVCRRLIAKVCWGSCTPALSRRKRHGVKPPTRRLA